MPTCALLRLTRLDQPVAVIRTALARDSGWHFLAAPFEISGGSVYLHEIDNASTFTPDEGTPAPTRAASQPLGTFGRYDTPWPQEMLAS
jgi:hypothetical protein